MCIVNNIYNMRCRWFFHNKPTENVCVKSNWNPPKRHPATEISLRTLETVMFCVAWYSS